jgi:hypothetical protein
LLTADQVSGALGTKPRSTLDDSTNKHPVSSNVVACRYQGEERLTVRGLLLPDRIVRRVRAV